MKTMLQNFLKRRILVLILALSFLSMVIYFASRKTPAAVIVYILKRTEIRSEVSDFGLTRFKHVQTVLSPNSGWVSQILAHIGQSVSKNQSQIFTLSAAPAPLLDRRTQDTLTAQWKSARSQAEQAMAQLARVRISLTAATRDLERATQAFQAGALSLQDLENLRTRQKDVREELHSIQAGLNAALHQRDAARAALSSSIPNSRDKQMNLAPIDGVVSWIYDENPRFVTVGTPLLDIAEPGRLYFEMDVLAREAVNIKSGMSVRFSEYEKKGRVRTVSPTALPKISPLGISEQRIRIWIDFDSQEPMQLPAGMELEAHIEIARQASALTVPSSATWSENNQTYVFQIINKSLIKTVVQCGLKTPREVEILSGLKEGDWIVRLPTEDMSAGAQVSPVHIKNESTGI